MKDNSSRVTALRSLPKHRYGTPVQLELPLFRGDSLRAATGAYFAGNTDGLSDATLKEYGERAAWLMRELGDETPLSEVNFNRIESVARKFRGIVSNETIKKRLRFLLLVLKYAHARGEIEMVPPLPRLKKDSAPRDTVHTVQQWQTLREFLPPGRFRDLYDLAFWTGQHTADLFTMQRWMVDLDRPILDEQGNEVGRGMWLRRNQKNRSEPLWLPMEPEFIEVARDLLFRLPDLRDCLLTGPMWNARRTFHMAADRAVADGHDIPRCSLIDLRRSFASMLIGRGRPVEYVRAAIGHKGQIPEAFVVGIFSGSVPKGPMAIRPNTATTHYIRATPALVAQGTKAGTTK